ncbi:MAG: hypothetical protein AAF959_19635, partial [Cyanobacteria bacterium P01_D01_bin.56]
MRDQLQRQGLVEALFEEFEDYLQQSGYPAKDGQIVDATLIPVPKQRNRKPENHQIKQGIARVTQVSDRWLQEYVNNAYGEVAKTASVIPKAKGKL